MPITSPSSGASVGRTGSLGASTATADPSHAGAGWCAFALTAGRFALDVRMVGEVVVIDRAIVVPRAPRGVLGLFNLRGLAVALVDLAVVLDMPNPAAPAPRAGAPLALVIRAGATVLAAIRVDAVLAVLPPDAAKVTAADRAVDHAAVAGFAATPSHGVVSILDATVVHQRLATLRAR